MNNTIKQVISNCNGNIECENTNLKAALIESTRVIKEDIIESERNNKIVNQTYELLLIVIAISAIIYAIKGWYTDIKYGILALVIVIITTIGLLKGSYILILSGLIVSVGFALYKIIEKD